MICKSKKTLFKLDFGVTCIGSCSARKVSTTLCASVCTTDLLIAFFFFGAGLVFGGYKKVGIFGHEVTGDSIIWS